VPNSFDRVFFWRLVGRHKDVTGILPFQDLAVGDQGAGIRDLFS
jgi:hypothetical protein